MYHTFWVHQPAGYLKKNKNKKRRDRLATGTKARNNVENNFHGKQFFSFFASMTKDPLVHSPVLILLLYFRVGTRGERWRPSGRMSFRFFFFHRLSSPHGSDSPPPPSRYNCLGLWIPHSFFTFSLVLQPGSLITFRQTCIFANT